MYSFLSQLFDTRDFPARWYCGLWSDGLGWLHIFSDIAIFGAYAAIPVTLVYLVRKRQDVPFRPIFWLFAVFIFSCGFGHLIEATVFWQPWYRFSGAVKLFTASVSWLTVFGLIKVMPIAVALPGPARVNGQLEIEIDERRHVEAALRQSAQRFRALVDASAQIVWTATGNGEVVEDSPSWRAFTGQTLEQWRGSERRDAYHPEDRDRIVALWRHAVATKTPFETEYRLRRNDGEWRRTAAHGLPLLNDDGTVREWVGMNTDITERTQAEQERERLTDQLRTLNAELEERVRGRTSELTGALKERDTLLQEVHHRVKNNLQVISSLINLQVRKLENIASRDALEECQTRVQTIALIHEMLYQSKDYSRVAFPEYARSLASNVFQTTDVSPSTVSLDLAMDNVALAVDKAIPCGLVLNELITNAVKHGFTDGRPGTIRVELSRLEGSRFRLAVKDNGVGLPAGFDIATSESLGLQLVSTLARQLDAELEVTSREGASVQLTFPAEG